MTKSFVVTVGRAASKPNGYKVRFTLVSGAVESVVGNPVASAGGASASHGESGFWKNRADPHSVRAAKLVFPNGTVQGYYKSEQEAAESLAFLKKNNMFGKDCTVVIEGGTRASRLAAFLASASDSIRANTKRGEAVPVDLGQSLGLSDKQLSAVMGVATLGARSMFSDLRSGAGWSNIFSASGGVLSDIYKNKRAWLMSFTDRVLERFPDADWGMSDTGALQISDSAGRLLISLGSVRSSGELVYVGVFNGEQLSGRTTDPSSLLRLIPRLGYGGV